MLDVDLLASSLNNPLDSWALIVDALVMASDQVNLVYTFLPPPLIVLYLLHRILKKGIQVILIALHWPRRIWCSDILKVLSYDHWALLDHLELLSQGPVFYPASQVVVFEGTA